MRKYESRKLSPQNIQNKYYHHDMLEGFCTVALRKFYGTQNKIKKEVKVCSEYRHVEMILPLKLWVLQSSSQEIS